MKTTRLSKSTGLRAAHFPLLAVTLMAGLVWLSASAQARQVTIEITATVSLVDDQENYLNNMVQPGDTVTGVYSYNTDAVDSNPLEQVGDYNYTTRPNGIRLSVDGLTFATNPRDVNFLVELVNNYESEDNYVVISYNNRFAVSVRGPMVMNTIDWQLDDPTQTALSSTDLPTTAPVLSDWQSIFGLSIMSEGPGAYFLIRANVTSAVRTRRL